MEQETGSFWADIKRFEDTLTRDPSSYCFAPLAELYRKVGLVDDAIGIAQRGIEIHPEYVGGYMALGRAYFEKGMKDECREALERVVRVTPDNLMAQKLLSQIYVDSGETERARKALEVILTLHPDDYESKVMFDALRSPASVSIDESYVPFDEPSIEEVETADFSGAETEFLAEAASEPEFLHEAPVEPVVAADTAGAELSATDDGIEQPEIIEELEDFVFEEAEILDESQTEGEWDGEGIIDNDAVGGDIELESGVDANRDPLTTVTLAELYTQQGFYKRALNIYRVLLNTDPANEDLQRRLLDLKQKIDDDEQSARGEVIFSGLTEEAHIGEAAEEPRTPVDVNAVFAIDPKERTIAVLNGWLDTIRRSRECRLERH